MNLHTFLRPHKNLSSIYMGLKIHSLFFDFSKPCQGKHLESSRIRENRPVPVHKLMEASHLFHHLISRSHVKVVRIGKFYLGSNLFQICGGYRTFYGSCCSHIHKNRSLNQKEDTINRHQLLFGINQGAVYEDIRIAHAREIADMDLDGYAVGGLAVGESHEEMYRILDAVVPCLPEEKPTYLMGVGTPANILEAVDRGVDFFDCVYPTRNGRHGHVYTNLGKLNLFNAKFELDSRPIEEGCQCPACRNYSRAYIRHLLKAKEMLGMRLCVLHNLYFYNKMMEEIREAIEQGTYQEYKKQKLEGFL